MSAMSLVDPFVIHHVHPTTLLALSTGVASAATLAAGLMGRWFTRMERLERVDVVSPPAPTSLTEQAALDVPGAGVLGSLTMPGVPNQGVLPPHASIAPIAPFASNTASTT